MTEVVLLRFNTPVLTCTAAGWVREITPREAIDLLALNTKFKAGPIYGEYNPRGLSPTVDPTNICLRVTSVFISDGALMGMVEPYGPMANKAQHVIGVLPISLSVRGTREYASEPTVDAKGNVDIVVKRLVDITAFDLYS